MQMTDEDAALLAISTLDGLSEQQQEAKTKIDSILASGDPFLDIHELFGLFDILYFRSLLSNRVEVSWSPRLTICAGICELVRDPSNGNKYTRIRLKLSEALLKFRPRSDVINTLLHEAIHAYFFITTSWRHSRGDDGTGHGAGFLLLADALNNHADYEVTVFHTFHDEVDSYRTHIWECDGPCKLQPPFFGLVKRSMNRAPGKGDTWWVRHQSECGGAFTKLAEPELTKDQVDRLSGLKKAGRQKNKIDQWVSRSKRKATVEETVDGLSEGRRSRSDMESSETFKRHKVMKDHVTCPICEQEVAADSINHHLDHDCATELG